MFAHLQLGRMARDGKINPRDKHERVTTRHFQLSSTVTTSFYIHDSLQWLGHPPREILPTQTSYAMSTLLDLYEPLDVIGNGSFGIIRKVKRKSDGLVS